MSLTFRTSRLEDPVAVALLEDYETELLGRGIVLDQGEPGGVDSEELVAPNGVFLIVEYDGDIAGCGGVRRLSDAGIAEMKRMYVLPHSRKRGVGSALLAQLEDEARTLGCRVARLDTGPGMEAALALYRGAGYHDIADYNGNPHAAYWLEKSL